MISGSSGMQLIDFHVRHYSACIAKLHTQMERLSQRQTLTPRNARVYYSGSVQMNRILIKQK